MECKPYLYKRHCLELILGITRLNNGFIAAWGFNNPDQYWKDEEKMYFASREEAVNYLAFRARLLVEEKLNELRGGDKNSEDR